MMAKPVQRLMVPKTPPCPSAPSCLCALGMGRAAQSLVVT